MRRAGAAVKRNVMMSRMKTIAVAVGVALLVGAASCSTSQPFSNSGLPKIQFVGDSITHAAAGAINARYGATQDVAIEATIGLDTYFQAPKIADQAALSPDVEVINLGTNDAHRMDEAWVLNGTVIEPQQTLADVTGRLDTFAAEFPASTCVVFVTTNTHNPSWSPANALAIDDHIRASFPHVADWDVAWQASYFDVPDDPHPNAVGREALLTLVDEAIATCDVTSEQASSSRSR